MKPQIFAWLPTAVFVVFVLALSWTGVYIVVSDLIAAAASSTISSTVDPVHE